MLKQTRDTRDSGVVSGGDCEKSGEHEAEATSESRKGDGYTTLAAAFLSLTSFITGGCSHATNYGPENGGAKESERARSLDGVAFEELVATKLGGASLEDQRTYGRGFISQEGVSAARELGRLFDPRELMFENLSVDSYLKRMGRMEELTNRLLAAEQKGVQEMIARAEATSIPLPIVSELRERSRVIREAERRLSDDSEFADFMVQQTELRYSDFVAGLGQVSPKP